MWGGNPFRSPEERATWAAMCAPAKRSLDWLDEKPISPATISALYALRGVPMLDDDAFRCAALWTRCEAWLAAQKMVAQSDCAGRLGKDQSMVAEELALYAHLNFGSVMAELALIDHVVESLGATWEALERGEVTLAHVKAIAKETRNCSPRVASYVEAKLIPLAIEKEWTPSELARAARRAVIEADPQGAEDRAAAAKKNSDVMLFGEANEMATMTSYGPAVTMTQIYDRLDARARELRAQGDPRNLGQLRIEALREAVVGADTSTWPAVRTDITIDLPSYLGLNNQPGELTGYGPITAATARALSTDAQLRRLITDPFEGTVIDVGRTRYRPTTRQHDIVKAVHPICAMPGCLRPSIHCDDDHEIDWGDGGHTSTCNLQPLCRRHHNLKTKKFWRIDQLPDGTEIWTSPLGRTYRKRHPTYPGGYIEPLPDAHEPPERIDDRLPDPDSTIEPPWARDADGIPLPEPPPLDDRELEEFEHAQDLIRCFGNSFIANAEAHYDEARALGLIA